jgi:hypothetical protein
VRQWFRKVLEDRYGLSSSNNRDKKDSAGALQEQRTRERGVASLSVGAVELTTQQEVTLLQEARKPQEVTLLL